MSQKRDEINRIVRKLAREWPDTRQGCVEELRVGLGRMNGDQVEFLDASLCRYRNSVARRVRDRIFDRLKENRRRRVELAASLGTRTAR